MTSKRLIADGRRLREKISNALTPEEEESFIRVSDILANFRNITAFPAGPAVLPLDFPDHDGWEQRTAADGLVDAVAELDEMAAILKQIARGLVVTSVPKVPI